MDPEPLDPIAPGISGPVLMNQDWRDLTFLHWAVEPSRVAGSMPPGVRPDVHEGATYVGLIPFAMREAGFGPRSSVPFLGDFLETNIRLYSVDEHGTRGVVFLTLETDRLLVVAGARLGFAVPYRWAAMSHRSTPAPTPRTKQPLPSRNFAREVAVSHGPVGNHHEYQWRARAGRAMRRSVVRVRVGERREASALDEFLTARWGLHTRHLGQSWYVPNAHEPWPLHDAEVLQLDDQLLAAHGFPDLARRPPDQVAFSPSVHAEFGRPRRLARPPL